MTILIATDWSIGNRPSITAVFAACHFWAGSCSQCCILYRFGKWRSTRGKLLMKPLIRIYQTDQRNSFTCYIFVFFARLTFSSGVARTYRKMWIFYCRKERKSNLIFLKVKTQSSYQSHDCCCAHRLQNILTTLTNREKKGNNVIGSFV